MTDQIGGDALIPNPKLQPFNVFIGEWTSVGTHPLVPGVTFHGRARFEWIESGAFLMLRTETDEPEIPSGLAIFGTDDATGECFMMYFDERTVSRKYEVALEGNVLRWWRNAPGFSQRHRATLSEDGRTLVGKGELSKDDKTWQGDLELTYSRVD
jgi:hypothetical protein